MDLWAASLLQFSQHYGLLIMISLNIVSVGMAIYKGVKEHERARAGCGNCEHNSGGNDSGRDDSRGCGGLGQ